MNMIRLARRFQFKLASNAAEVFKKITAVRQLVKDIVAMKKNFLAASKTESYTEASLDDLEQISQQYLSTAYQQGLDGQQHEFFLANLKENVEQLEQIDFTPKFPTSAGEAVPSQVLTNPLPAQKLATLKQLILDIVPVDLPQIKPKTVAPIHYPGEIAPEPSPAEILPQEESVPANNPPVTNQFSSNWKYVPTLDGNYKNKALK